MSEQDFGQAADQAPETVDDHGEPAEAQATDEDAADEAATEPDAE